MVGLLRIKSLKVDSIIVILITNNIIIGYY
jgi:hypothetical protein